MLMKIKMLEAKYILLKASADRDLPSQVPQLYCGYTKVEVGDPA